MKGRRDGREAGSMEGRKGGRDRRELWQGLARSSQGLVAGKEWEAKERG